MTSSAAELPSKPGPRRIHWLRNLGFCCILLLLAQVAFFLVVFTNPQRGIRLPDEALMAAAVDAGGYVSVEFQNSRGLKLRGELLGDVNTRKVVVFGHGFRMMRRQGDGLAHELLRAGYAVMLFDFRGCGESEGLLTSGGPAEAHDAIAALHYLRQARRVPGERIAYVGFSMGAAAALLAGETLGEVKTLILLAPFANLEQTFEVRTRRFAGLPIRPWLAPVLALYSAIFDVDTHAANPEDRIGEFVNTPLTLLGGQDDWRAPMTDLRALKDALPAANLIVLKGMDHLDLARFPVPLCEEVLRLLSQQMPAH